MALWCDLGTGHDGVGGAWEARTGWGGLLIETHTLFLSAGSMRSKPKTRLDYSPLRELHRWAHDTHRAFPEAGPLNLW